MGTINKVAPRLIIEALFLRAKGNYGFREYFLNILNYLIEHNSELRYSQVIIFTGKRALDVIPPLPTPFKLETVEISNPLQVYWHQNHIYRRFKLSSEDVIMFTSDVPALVKHCKHLLVVHDWLFLRKDLAPSWLFRFQRQLFVPFGARKCDRIITISEWVKKDVIEHSTIKPDRIVPIYNYLDFQKYEAGEVSKDLIRFCNTNQFFLAVSSAAPHKNLISLLRAYCDYRKNSSNINKLVLVGSLSGEAKLYLDELEQDVKRDVIEMKNISNRDLGYLYQNAKAFISATLFEGFGMPIAEAMYFNIPVIVSDIEVVREITDNKAVYFNPIDYKELAEIMESIGNYKPDLTAKSIMIEKYSKQYTVTKYLDVINSMIDI